MADKMDIDDLDDGKIESSPSPSPAPDDRMTTVVKTRTPNYVPPGFQVRARIDEYMFTAECRQRDLDAAASDDQIESLGPARKLRVIS
jgi:hypothetical protein